MEQTSKISKLYLIIGIMFVSCLLISNVIAGRLITVFGMVLPGSVILFPITYIFGDVITEVYGFKKSRFIIWCGLFSNLLMSASFIAVISLPHPSFWHDSEAFSTALGMTPRIVIASILAYSTGEFSNSIVLSRMKVLTSGKWLWLRTIGSTIVGQGLDTIIFITAAFYGTVPNNILLSMILFQYLWKVCYEVILTPITCVVIKWIKQKENLDVYDTKENYSPFGL